jgi:hypothetical protein
MQHIHLKIREELTIYSQTFQAKDKTVAIAAFLMLNSVMALLQFLLASNPKQDHFDESSAFSGSGS